MALIDHWWLLLAYAGMLIHVLMKVEEERKRGSLSTFGGWIKDNIISLIISIISIPLLIVSIDTPGVDELIGLKINNVSSILLGYQTQSIFKSLMSIAGRGIPKTTKNKPKKNNNESTATA